MLRISLLERDARQTRRHNREAPPVSACSGELLHGARNGKADPSVPFCGPTYGEVLV